MWLVAKVPDVAEPWHPVWPQPLDSSLEDANRSCGADLLPSPQQGHMPKPPPMVAEPSVCLRPAEEHRILWRFHSQPCSFPLPVPTLASSPQSTVPVQEDVRAPGMKAPLGSTAVFTHAPSTASPSFILHLPTDGMEQEQPSTPTPEPPFLLQAGSNVAFPSLPFPSPVRGREEPADAETASSLSSDLSAVCARWVLILAR